MFRIKKLDLFIARQFGQLFAGTFFISLFVLMMQFLWRYVDTLIGKGLSVDVLAEFFWYMALIMVPQALPLAILLSSLITYGNLGESSELTAIKAAGISLLQSMRGLIVVSVCIAFVSFYFQNNVAPNAQLKLAQLMLSMKQKSPELDTRGHLLRRHPPDQHLRGKERPADGQALQHHDLPHDRVVRGPGHHPGRLRHAPIYCREEAPRDEPL